MWLPTKFSHSLEHGAVGAALAAKRAGKEMELLACQPGKFADKSAPTCIICRLLT